MGVVYGGTVDARSLHWFTPYDFAKMCNRIRRGGALTRPPPQRGGKIPSPVGKAEGRGWESDALRHRGNGTEAVPYIGPPPTILRKCAIVSVGAIHESPAAPAGRKNLASPIGGGGPRSGGGGVPPNERSLPQSADADNRLRAVPSLTLQEGAKIFRPGAIRFEMLFHPGGAFLAFYANIHGHFPQNRSNRLVYSNEVSLSC